MNRFDRIVTILIQLQSRRVVKAQEIADRFNISLRTVYRDIRTLEQAGIPIIGEAGVGYSIMSGYRLPPIMFTENEVTSFLIAEKLIDNIMDSSTADNFRSAMDKIKSVLNTSERDSLQNLDHNVEVVKQTLTSSTNKQNKVLQLVFRSIIDKKILDIKYNALYNEQITERSIEPIGAYYYADNWHLIAFCRLRNDYRDFRFDRIIKIIQTDKVFTLNHPTLKEYLKQISTEMELTKVVILVKKSAAHLIRNQKYYYGLITEKEKDEYFEMTFLTSSLTDFAHWILFLTNSIEIKSPKTLVNEMKYLVKELKNHYH